MWKLLFVIAIHCIKGQLTMEEGLKKAFLYNTALREEDVVATLDDIFSRDTPTEFDAVEFQLFVDAIKTNARELRTSLYQLDSADKTKGGTFINDVIKEVKDKIIKLTGTAIKIIDKRYKSIQSIDESNGRLVLLVEADIYRYLSEADEPAKDTARGLYKTLVDKTKEANKDTPAHPECLAIILNSIVHEKEVMKVKKEEYCKLINDAAETSVKAFNENKYGEGREEESRLTLQKFYENIANWNCDTPAPA
eukprot:GHVR01117234.1.p1 GENE.GHVR01117234.1~~GHVR01117234.1.p1  ORF type:complete len:251 (+),score=72.72 GHVR01117234.1:77-829(+)